MRFTGVLLGTFNGHDDVVMDRSCIERTTREAARVDAELMLRLCVNCDPNSDANEWRVDVEISE
jgi:hypothetical protein